jgi:transcriptional regulator with XRE-family HTH domain
MATRDPVPAAARRAIERAIRDLVDDLRRRRIALGLSLDVVARAAGISPALLSRLERHHLQRPRPDHLAAVAAALGLDLRLTAYPAGEPIGDRVQLRLMPAFRARIHPAVLWRGEVGLPIRGDRRAWDAVAICEDGGWTGLEGISRFGEVDGILRRVNLKQRDDPRITRVVLVVSDTVRNRDALRLGGATVRADFPLDTRGVLAALGAGRTPPLNGVVLLRVPRDDPQAVHTGGNPVDAPAVERATFVDNRLGGPEGRR